mmetsp:Transcript_56406/g.63181  ORF Transcript_56406/g.63181 Transcript_56406/m.63181 type:complete len:841 (-) Transcript_56406:1912-4434(-)
MLVRTAMMQNNRKRTSSGTKHNNGRGRLSRAALQRIFMIMMGIVFCMYFLITIYLIQHQESNTTAFETEGGKQGPVTITYNKNKILREHIANVKARKSHTNNDDNEKAVLKNRQRQNSSISNANNKIHHRKEPTSSKFDLEEVEIHGMKHPKTINRGKESATTHSSSKTLKAYLEPVYLQDWEIKPLPVRNVTEDLLTVIEYSKVNSCQRLPELLPVDNYPDGDSFLPWIHDVFPTDDGRFIQFVAQNKRRCQSGTTPDQLDILEKMQPQLSLLQHVPIKRIKMKKENVQQQSEDEEIRYKLTSHKEADPDGIETRFICKFSDNQETLSHFNFNYDYVAKRKRNKHLFTKDGHKDNKSIHTSQLIFMCPVPTNLIEIVRDGTSVIDDYATVFVSLIPIRTPPRYGNPDQFLPPQYQIEGNNPQIHFNASVEWGDAHILPRIKDSGRWENIPVCLPTWKAYPAITSPPLLKEEMFEQPEDVVGVSSFLNSTINTKKHRVVATTWASSSYSTRGDRFAIDDGARRLDEWIRFHLMVGIDHIFIFDNSQGENSLIDVTTQFPNKVTRIRWPASVCNNNRSFHDNPGERSSQYAAESSGRLRFGPHTDWMANFDVDEYITPVGEFSLKAFLTNLDNHNTKIVSFGSWRAWPRRDLIEDPIPIQNKTICDQPHPCFELKVPNNYSILQTYNCDRQLVKTEKMPAEKQIYRTDYVLQHFVHFSTVTTYTMMNMKETIAAGMNFWKVAPDPLSRFADEQIEVTMLHAKAMATQDTAGWQKRCKGELKGECRIGVPHPDLNASSTVIKDNLGWLYNCYVNPKIEDYLIPLLNEEMKKSKIVNFTRSYR